MIQKKSSQIALGGVFSALCLLLMFMSSVLPFASFALPMIAGATLMAVATENGEKTAWLVYISVSLLSVFIVPDVDAKLIFISFFGYYPVLKPRLERIRRPLQTLVKLLILNAAMILAYFASLHLFGMDEAAGQSEFMGKYLPLFTLIGLNFIFFIYDFLLARYLVLYKEWFKPTFLRK